MLATSPKDTLRTAFKYNLLCKEDAALNMLQARNQTLHLYNEEMTEEIIEAIRTEYVLVLRSNLDLQKQITEGELIYSVFEGNAYC